MNTKRTALTGMRWGAHAPAVSLLPIVVLSLQAVGCGSRATDLPRSECADGVDCSIGGQEEGTVDTDGASGSGEGSASSGGEQGDGAGTDDSSADGADGAGSPSAPAASTTGPRFSGSGDGFRPLTTGCGPETAGLCGGACERGEGNATTTVVRPPATLCFAGEGDTTPEDPSVVIEQVIERTDEQAYAHIRVTFDPSFTDNTYGEGSIGWPRVRGHRFRDLTGSDHTELQLTTASGAVAMNFKIDLASQSADADCGFGTGGVLSGDGDMLLGDAAHVLAVSTSLDRNLNGCGYCALPVCGSSGDCTVDSPATDELFTPNPEAPNWDFRQVYEVWVDLAAFGDDGFGQAFVTYTHSSPAKASTDTIEVTPTPCPPEWEEPYCPPNVLLEGGNCFGTPPPSGEDSDPPAGEGEDPPAGEEDEPPAEECPPNQQVYVITEGASLCTPIPFTNNPDMEACPAGYVLDLASEGQFCVPE